MTGVNALHRPHYKSGSCLSQHPLERPLVISRKFLRMLEAVAELGRRERANGEIAALTAPRRSAGAVGAPRTTQSIFGRAASRLKNFFTRKAA